MDNILKVSKEINSMMKADYNRISYNVVKKVIPSRKVISLRRTIPDYNCESSLWNDMFKYINKNHIQVANDGYCVAIFHDEEYKSHDTDIEIQLSVDELYNDSDDIKFFSTQEVEVASITFTGSYDKMSGVTKSLMFWIDLNNYELLQPTFNIYHISPAQDNNSANWITESCFIIKKRENINHGTSNN